MKFSAVLFDMDGLMIDSEPLAKEAWRQVISSYGATLDEAMFGEMLGLRQVECSQLIRERLALPVSAEELARRRNELFMEMLPGRLQAMPGLFDLLDWLKAQKVPRALVTSGLARYVEAVLRELALEGTFEVVMTGEDVSRGKPAPDCYTLAAERLDLPDVSRGGRQGLVLEDAPNGVAAAKAAGMTCWAVPNEEMGRLDLSSADQIFPSLYAVRDELARLWDD